MDEDFEFLELLNSGKEQVEISGYSFTDGIDFTFPQGTVIHPGEYILLAVNPEIYSNLGIQVFKVSTGRLDNAGEVITLRDHQNMVVDQVHFDDHYPWPREPDGEGPSLELKSPELDNGLASSWKASEQTGGTPGSGEYTGFEEMDPLPRKYTQLSISPNPFHHTVFIRYTIHEESEVTIRIINISGQEVARMNRGKQAPGVHEIKWAPDNLPGGLYFLHLNPGSDHLKRKLLYVKLN